MQIAFYYARILKPESEILRYKYVVTHYSDTIYYGEAVYKVVKLLLEKDELDEAEYYLLKLITIKFISNNENVQIVAFHSFSWPLRPSNA